MDCTPDRVRQLLDAYWAVADRPDDPELAAVMTAVLLEDTFDVTLTDDDISASTLTDPAEVAAVLARRRGGR